MSRRCFTAPLPTTESTTLRFFPCWGLPGQSSSGPHSKRASMHSSAVLELDRLTSPLPPPPCAALLARDNEKRPSLGDGATLSARAVPMPQMPERRRGPISVNTCFKREGEQDIAPETMTISRIFPHNSAYFSILTLGEADASFSQIL